MKRILITGILGQDGANLAEMLLNKGGYEVYGLVRRTANEHDQHRYWRISSFRDNPNLKLVSGSIDTYQSIHDVISKVRPDELYHLAAQSFVTYSFEDEFSTMHTNATGTHNVLAAAHKIVPDVRFYFAGSSVGRDTKILVRLKKNKETKLLTIGKFYDLYKDGEFECLATDPKTLKTTFKNVQGVSKHRSDRCYNLKFANGGELFVTGDHSVMVFGKEGTLVPKLVETLKIGDHLVTPRLDEKPGEASVCAIPQNSTAKNNGYKQRQKDYQEAIQLTPELWELLGMYAAEGRTELAPSWRANFTFHLKETYKTERLLSLVQKYFPETNFLEREDPSRTTRTVDVFGKTFTAFCYEMIGVGSHTKVFPSRLFSENWDSVRSFLYGYSCDAYVTAAELKYASCNKDFAEGVLWILRLHGISAQICRSESKPANPKRVENTVAYHVSVARNRSLDILGEPTQRKAGTKGSKIGCLPDFLFREHLGCSAHHRTGLSSRRHLQEVYESKPMVKFQGKLGKATLPPQLEKLLYSDLGSAQVTAITALPFSESVFDVSVEDCHTFVGGNVPIVLHNSEMYGKVAETPQKETTRFHPRSVYGVSKVAGFELVRHYRERYGMFCCNGILFNHSGFKRGNQFVERKITLHAAAIQLGLVDKLYLGNIDSQRDFGDSRDYVEAMWLMLQHKEPDDYVVASGVTHTIREVLDIAFEKIDKDWKPYVQHIDALLRPAEVDLLLGDATKARTVLGWEPKISFKQMIREMVVSDIQLLNDNPTLAESLGHPV